MPGFGAIGEFAIGEFGGDGGVELLIPNIAVATALPAPVVQAGALADVPATDIAVAVRAPAEVLSAPAVAVSVAASAPELLAGVTLDVPAVAVAVAVPAPEPLAGTTLDIPGTAVAVVAPVLSVSGGADADPASVGISVTVQAPEVVAGAIVDVPVTSVQLAAPAPSVGAGAYVDPASVPVAVSVPAPLVSAGAIVALPKAIGITVAVPKPFLNVVGVLLDVSNQIAIGTDGSIAETAITEQAEDNVFPITPAVTVRAHAPGVFAGTILDIGRTEILFAPLSPEVGARIKPVRIQAIAS